MYVFHSVAGGNARRNSIVRSYGSLRRTIFLEIDVAGPQVHVVGFLHLDRGKCAEKWHVQDGQRGTENFILKCICRVGVVGFL